MSFLAPQEIFVKEALMIVRQTQLPLSLSLCLVRDVANVNLDTKLAHYC